VTDADRRFAEQAIRRKDLFKNLSVLSVIVGALLGAYFAVESSRDPNFEWGVRAVLVVMILLSGRQNLRQYKYARVMEGLLGSDASEE
jgi:uncharacterized membrane protein (UPF0136 family)